jgi:hypothetical protein
VISRMIRRIANFTTVCREIANLFLPEPNVNIEELHEQICHNCVLQMNIFIAQVGRAAEPYYLGPLQDGNTEDDDPHRSYGCKMAIVRTTCTGHRVVR